MLLAYVAYLLVSKCNAPFNSLYFLELCDSLVKQQPIDQAYLKATVSMLRRQPWCLVLIRFSRPERATCIVPGISLLTLKFPIICFSLKPGYLRDASVHLQLSASFFNVFLSATGQAPLDSIYSL